VVVDVTEWAGGASRQVGADYVEYTNVSRDDVHVLQCNASNVHGYLFLNAFLNVLGIHCYRYRFTAGMFLQIYSSFGCKMCTKCDVYMRRFAW